MESAKNIISYLRSGFTCFWIWTVEMERALEILKEYVGLYERKDGSRYRIGDWNCGKGMDPIAPLKELEGLNEDSVCVLRNFHWFIDKPQVIQKIQNMIEDMKSDGKAIIVVSPKREIPVELEKEFVMMELELPNEDETIEMVEFVVRSTIESGAECNTPEDEDLEAVVEASKGLTLSEMENVFSRSITETGGFDVGLISKQKNQAVEGSGLIEIKESNLTFDDYKSNEKLKEFANLTVYNPESLGMLLIGPPGCGKTYFMDCLAGETGLPTIVFDQGRVMSKFQGESDRNLREVIKIIRAFGRCIVQVDEFEKQFAGAGGTGHLDSGVTKRVTSLWLRFMSEVDRRKGVYIIGTCNSFHGIPSAYLRPGRWDTSPFFIDIPTEEEKMEIAKYHIEKNNLDLPDDDRLDMDDYTGADIAAACKLAATMGVTLKKASEYIIPQTKTMADEIRELREWAKGNTVPATEINLNGYVDASKKSRRKRRLRN